MESEVQASQASSHFPLEPIVGTTLFELENARRLDLKQKGTLRIGCPEVDEQVLINGFERGAVVGISAEEIETGLLLALQTVAHNLVFGAGGAPSIHRAAVITHLAIPVILPTLRNIIKAQVQSKLGTGHADLNISVRQCLERISISRVFDVEGLWEVLSELEVEPPVPTPKKEETIGVTSVIQQVSEPEILEEPKEPESSPLSSPPPSSPVTELPPLRENRVAKTEIQDSEDESNLSSPAPTSPAMPRLHSLPIEELELPKLKLPVSPSQHEGLRHEESSAIPEIILITHFSTLLNTLFTQRDRSSAHSTLQLLSSHLRYLSRSAGPLIMLLNTTTNTPSKSSATSGTTAPTTPQPRGTRPPERPLDPTLRSIFNPPPPSHTGYDHGGMALSKKNKPAFGLTFSQFLDLHLLCTRLPKTRADAENLYAPVAAPSSTAVSGGIKYAWIIEVLLDESGIWDSVGKRVDREQRWGAVEVKDSVRIVDAFAKQEKQYNAEPFKLAAGFGGRRV